MAYIPIDTDQFTGRMLSSAPIPELQWLSGKSVLGSNSGWISNFLSLPTNPVIIPIIIVYRSIITHRPPEGKLIIRFFTC